MKTGFPGVPMITHTAATPVATPTPIETPSPLMKLRSKRDEGDVFVYGYDRHPTSDCDDCDNNNPINDTPPPPPPPSSQMLLASDISYIDSSSHGRSSSTKSSVTVSEQLGGKLIKK